MVLRLLLSSSFSELNKGGLLINGVSDDDTVEGTCTCILFEPAVFGGALDSLSSEDKSSFSDECDP